MLNAETVSELLEQRRRQSFSHDVCNLMLCGNMQNFELTKLHFFSHKVDIKLDVFCPAMMYWVL